MYRKIVFASFVMLGSLFSCTKDKEERSGVTLADEILIHATIENQGISTRADENEKPADGQECFLYLPIGSFNNTDSIRIPVKYSETMTKWEYTDEPLHWDDIKPALSAENTTFHLLSTDATIFPDGTKDDILWGEDKGWLKEPLDFELRHLMSKLTFVFEDKTLKSDINFENSKIVLDAGLYRHAHAIDLENGIIYIDKGKTNREEQTITTGPVINEEDKNATLEFGIIPPQKFAGNTQLEVTAGQYVYRIPLPEKMIDKEGSEEDIELKPGEHLTITITLTEDTLAFEATLKDWELISDKTIDVSRVFNIGSKEELKDLMLAVNTGYTFKGMVVRLTKDLVLTSDDQINLGNEKYPFEGIFDGNGKTISGLNQTGGLFGYTRGATIQNVKLVAPRVESSGGSLGTLVNKAENTTIFYCSTLADGLDLGDVNGSGNNTGGLIGEAIGTTSLSNCYAIVPVTVNVTANNIGGLIGYSEGTVTHCLAQGAVQASAGSSVGGLIGYCTNTVLLSCAWGEVLGKDKTGGLIGHMDGLVSNSYAEGKVIASGADKGSLLGSMGFSGNALYCLWSTDGGITNAIGTSTISETCKPFSGASGVEEVVSRLNTGYTGTWKIHKFDNTDRFRAYFTTE